jgi:hypothetical protein
METPEDVDPLVIQVASAEPDAQKKKKKKKKKAAVKADGEEGAVSAASKEEKYAGFGNSSTSAMDSLTTNFKQVTMVIQPHEAKKEFKFWNSQPVPKLGRSFVVTLFKHCTLTLPITRT